MRVSKAALAQLHELVSGGVFGAEAVVEAARPEDAPLHSYFEWDDTEAARRYRL